MKNFFISNVYPKAYLENLEKILSIKVTGICKAEIENVTEDDCINYIFNLVINRTFDVYQAEIQTIYSQLEKLLGVKIYPAPDNWDRC